MDENKVENRLSAVESESHDNKVRIDYVEKKQDDLDKLISSVATMANEQEHIKTDVKEIKQDVRSLTEVPAKRWNSVVDKVLMLLVGAVIGWILVNIGL